MFNFKHLKAISLIIGSLFYTGTAFASEPNGCYEVDTGKFSASINAPKILNLNVSTPVVGLLGITDSFSVDAETGDNVFVISIPIISMLNETLPTAFHGTWAMTKDPKFTVTLTEINDLINELESTLGISADVTVTQSFAGKVLENGDKISGKFALGLKANIMGFKGSAKVNSTFIATRSSSEPCVQDEENQPALLSALKDKSLAKNASANPASIVANYIINVLKSLF